MFNENNVLLLRPPIHEKEARFAPKLESLGIEYIVASCKKSGIRCNYIDANLQNFSVQDVLSYIQETKPLFIGISITTERIREETVEIIKGAKQLIPEPIVFVGGHFVSYAYEVVLHTYKNLIDIVFLGESELTIVDAIKCFNENRPYSSLEGIAYLSNGKTILNENHSKIINYLNTLSWPVRDYTHLAIEKTGLFCIISSRGCYGNCKFCAINNFTTTFHYKKWRGRDIENFVDEISYGVELGAKYILICDDNFIAPGKYGKERVGDFIGAMNAKHLNCEYAFFCRCNDIIRIKELLPELIACGLRHVFLGVESASQTTLDFFNKEITPETARKAINICHDLDIMTEIGFIMFEPYSTVETILNNLYFLQETKLNSIYHINTKLSVYYGSSLIEILEKDKLLETSNFTLTYKYLHEEIQVIESLVNLLYQELLPIVTILEELKDCITITWYKKDIADLSEILDIEQAINDKLTNILVDQINSISNTPNLCEEPLPFFEQCSDEYKKQIGTYYFLLLEYQKLTKEVI
jgi:radical SAM superfamily enzyme YgiQ (UPF0313 family)